MELVMEFDFFAALGTLETSLDFEFEGNCLMLRCTDNARDQEIRLVITQNLHNPETFDAKACYVSRFCEEHKIIASECDELQEAIEACELYFYRNNLKEDIY